MIAQQRQLQVAAALEAIVGSEEDFLHRRRLHSHTPCRAG
jgi:hypothetical protein